MDRLVVDHLLVFGVAQLVALVPDVAEGVVDADGGCMEQGLGRDAADIRAIATDPAGLDQGDVVSEAGESRSPG